MTSIIEISKFFIFFCNKINYKSGKFKKGSNILLSLLINVYIEFLTKDQNSTLSVWGIFKIDFFLT